MLVILSAPSLQHCLCFQVSVPSPHVTSMSTTSFKRERPGMKPRVIAESISLTWPVSDMRDVERLTNSSQTTGAWIGLHSIPGTERSWHWSLPGVEFKESETEWKQGQPGKKATQKNCVVIKEQKWRDLPCNNERGFICYNGENTYLILILCINLMSYCVTILKI